MPRLTLGTLIQAAGGGLAANTAARERERNRRLALEDEQRQNAHQIALAIAQLGGTGSTLGDLSKTVSARRQETKDEDRKATIEKLLSEITLLSSQGLPRSFETLEGATQLAEAGDLEGLRDLRNSLTTAVGATAKAESDLESKEKSEESARQESRADKGLALDEAREARLQELDPLQRELLEAQIKRTNEQAESKPTDLFTKGAIQSQLIQSAENSRTLRFQQLIDAELVKQIDPSKGLLKGRKTEEELQNELVNLRAVSSANDASTIEAASKWLSLHPEWKGELDKAFSDGVGIGKAQLESLGVDIDEADDAQIRTSLDNINEPIPPDIQEILNRIQDPDSRAKATAVVNQLRPDWAKVRQLMAAERGSGGT